MKLTALKKVHVIFCLTCVYSAHHGWAMEDEATNSSGSNSPRTSTPDEAFQIITNEGFLEEDSTKVVTAPPPQKNSTLWDYTLGFVLPKAKKPIPDATKAVSPAIELLKSEPDEAKTVVVDTGITTDNSVVIAPSKPDDLEQGDNDASEEDSSDEIKVSDTEEDSASDMDEGSVSDTRAHEDFKEKALELNSAASNAPIPVVADEESDEEALNDSLNKPADDLSLSLSHDLSITQTEKHDSAQITEYLQHPPTVKKTEILPSTPSHLTSGQEGEGTHIFNQGHDGSGILGAHFMASLSEKVVSATQALNEGKEHVMQAAIVLWNDPDFWKNLVGDPGDYDGGYAGDYSSPFVQTLLFLLNRLIPQTMETAIQRETQLKKGSRKIKLMLIESISPEWKDLYNDIV